MPDSNYVPQPASVAGRVCAYFKTNPDEQLSSADISLKFDAQVSSVSALLHKCFETKLLRRLSTRGELIVCAGDRLAETDIQAGPVTIPALPTIGATPTQRKARRSLPPLDVSKLAIVSKAPPPKRCNTPGTDWPAIFAKLQVGQAIEDLPIDYYGSMAKASQAWCKANGTRFELRKLDDGKCGLYRVE